MLALRVNGWHTSFSIAQSAHRVFESFSSESSRGFILARAGVLFFGFLLNLVHEDPVHLLSRDSEGPRLLLLLGGHVALLFVVTRTGFPLCTNKIKALTRYACVVTPPVDSSESRSLARSSLVSKEARYLIAHSCVVIPTGCVRGP